MKSNIPTTGVTCLPSRYSDTQRVRGNTTTRFKKVSVPFRPRTREFCGLAGRLERHVVASVVDGVHQAVLPGILGLEDVIAVGVLGDLLDRLPRVLRQDLVDALTHLEQI